MSDIMMVVFRVPQGTVPPSSADKAVALMRSEASPQVVLIARETLDGLALAAIGKYVQKAVKALDNE